MSVLSEVEKKCINDILKYMDDDSVGQVARLITNGPTPKDRYDSISRIILHAKSLYDFLSRQKVTNNHLFEYLNSKGLAVPVKKKKDMIKQIYDYLKLESCNLGKIKQEDPIQAPKPKKSSIKDQEPKKSIKAQPKKSSPQAPKPKKSTPAQESKKSSNKAQELKESSNQVPEMINLIANFNITK